MFKICLGFFIMLFVISCVQDENDFVYNEESISLNDILKVKLYDISNNEAVEVTTDYLKDKWEKELAMEGINVSLEKFEIIQSKTQEGTATFFLKAKSTNGTVETGAFIVPQNENDTTTKLPDSSYLLKGKTCTCQGCPQGCRLHMNGSTCTCTTCPAGGSQACTKTETESER